MCTCVYVCVCVIVAQSCLTLCKPMDCNCPGSSVHGILQARILGVGCHFLLQGIWSSRPRDQTWVSHIQADSLLSEPPGEPIGFKSKLGQMLLFNGLEEEWGAKAKTHRERWGAGDWDSSWKTWSGRGDKKLDKGKPGEEFRKERVPRVAERTQGLMSEQSLLDVANLEPFPECGFRYSILVERNQERVERMWASETDKSENMGFRAGASNPCSFTCWVSDFMHTILILLVLSCLNCKTEVVIFRIVRKIRNNINYMEHSSHSINGSYHCAHLFFT